METSLNKDEQSEIFDKYHVQQNHSSLVKFLSTKPKTSNLIQLTTHSRLLTQAGQLSLADDLQMKREDISLMNLQQFDTKIQFEKQLKLFLSGCSKSDESLLLVQCDVDSEDSLKLIDYTR